jgi:hypothetical protein
MPTNGAAKQAAKPRFRMEELEEVRSGVPYRRAESSGQAVGRSGNGGAFTQAPASRGKKKLARTASEDVDAGVAAEDKNVYRLSDLPADVIPDLAIAQGVSSTGRHRGVQTSALQVVEIASAIAGATMTRVLDNQGDVSWELDQLPRDAIHPGGASTTPGSDVWQTQTISVPGLRCENKAGQETFADFEVSFKYNGSSVGFVEVSTTKAEDAWGWGLSVKENITADPNSYDTVPPSGQRFAAAKLRFHFRFDHTPLQDVIGIIDLTLYGNGKFAEAARWTQP